MSFSGETKNSLCAIRVKKHCCRCSLLYGMLLLSNTYRGDLIRMSTENERTSQTVMRLLEELYFIEGELKITERHTRAGEPYSSYTVTVRDPADLQTLFMAYGRPQEEKELREQPEELRLFHALNETVFLCPECARHFARGVFLSAGSISDPKSGYHLDITTGRPSLSEALKRHFEEQGLSPRETFRKQSSLLYFKERESIEDFLTYVGAPQAALSVMDVSIYREIRNQENRHSNCDAANISKMTGTAARYRKAIASLRASGRFDSLPEVLQETARLREELPEASLQELADAHTPPITKSGVNHRLAKILASAEGEGI